MTKKVLSEQKKKTTKYLQKTGDQLLKRALHFFVFSFSIVRTIWAYGVSAGACNALIKITWKCIRCASLRCLIGQVNFRHPRDQSERS